MSPGSDSLGRWWRTVRYLRPRQVLNRASQILRRRAWRWLGATCPRIASPGWRELSPLWVGLEAFPGVAAFAADRGEAQHQAGAAREHRFTFLGRAVQLGEKIDWSVPGESQLWRYHLHYFDCVRALLIVSPDGGAGGYETFRSLAQSWIEGNRALRGDGWHPYTLSLRLVNWLQVALTWKARFAADAAFAQVFRDSLYAQARLLHRQREYDVRGNHLLENIRALLWAGLAFEGREARRWLDDALADLKDETAEQILPDGGHFERTPGYHAVVLRDYLEIAVLLERAAGGCPDWVRNAVQRQAYFLRDLVGTTGRVPLFKDTAYDAMPDPAELLNLAAAWLDDVRLKPAAPPRLETCLWFGPERWNHMASWAASTPPPGAFTLNSSKYCLMRSNTGEQLVVDVGAPCPDYLPAHAHADTLSYEYAFRGRPVVVDAGVYEYRPGPWRDFFRSTRAHNTVEVAGQNSSEVWSSFRVGRRARATLKQWSIGTEDRILFASHDGYTWLPGAPVHDRVMLWRTHAHLIVVDRVVAAVPHPIVNRVHLHPDLKFETDGPGRWRIDVGPAPLWLHQIGSGEARIRQGGDESDPRGWYSERFGAKRPASVLEWSAHPDVRQVLAYAFSGHREFSAILRIEATRVFLDFDSGRGTGCYLISDHGVELLP